MPLSRGLVCAAFIAGAGLAGLAQEPPPRDPDIQSLVAATSAVPPEFAADALIRLSGSSRITETAWRRELLDEAFVRAYGAQEQYRRSAIEPVSPDSRQGANDLAASTSLNRVSLQVRAAQLMAFVDARRAHELFEWIDLNLEPAVCEEPLVPVVDEYDAALSVLARTAFGADRAEGLRFLELYLWRAHLPSEMPAVARALQRFRPRPDEAAYLEGLFHLILEASSSDARGFSSSSIDIVSKTADLQSADRALGVPHWFVMEALRTYLLAQLKAPRCGDSISESLMPSTFNAALNQLHAGRDVAPFDGAAARPSKMLAGARVDWYWQTPEARALHDQAQRLWGSGKAPVSIRVRQTTDWRNQAAALLIDLEQWPGRREATERDYFYQKSVLYVTLLDLLPPGQLRARTIRSFVDSLSHADIDRDRRTLWFAFVTRLLDMRSDRREILAALEDSHQPVLSLYARMERAMPQARRATQ